MSTSSSLTTGLSMSLSSSTSTGEPYFSCTIAFIEFSSFPTLRTRAGVLNLTTPRGAVHPLNGQALNLSQRTPENPVKRTSENYLLHPCWVNKGRSLARGSWLPSQPLPETGSALSATKRHRAPKTSATGPQPKRSHPLDDT